MQRPTSIAVLDMRGAGAGRPAAHVLEDPTGRRARYMRRCARVVSACIALWLGLLLLGGVGLLPAQYVPLARFVRPASDPPPLPPAAPRPATAARALHRPGTPATASGSTTRIATRQAHRAQVVSARPAGPRPHGRAHAGAPAPRSAAAESVVTPAAPAPTTQEAPAPAPAAPAPSETATAAPTAGETTSQPAPVGGTAPQPSSTAGGSEAAHSGSTGSGTSSSGPSTAGSGGATGSAQGGSGAVGTPPGGGATGSGKVTGASGSSPGSGHLTGASGTAPGSGHPTGAGAKGAQPPVASAKPQRPPAS